MVELEEPDKGRAWVVALSACIINMILSGISRMVSILYVNVIAVYGVTRGEATLPFTVRNSVRCLAGPLVGIVGVRFGIKSVTFFGGILAFLGAALCSVAPNIVWLTLLWGVIHGLGFALANTLFQVTVNQYFVKYRATASGIALSGACVGSLGFPVFVEWLIETYGLSGSFLILGGVVMHVLPPALMLSSPQWVEHPAAYARLWSLKHTSVASSSSIETVESSFDETEGDETGLEKDRLPQNPVNKTVSMSNNPVESANVSKASRDHNQGKQRGLIFDHSQEKVTEKVVCTGYKARKNSSIEKSDSNSRNKTSSNDDFGIFTISSQFDKQKKDSPSCPLVSKTNNNTPSVYEMLKSMIKLYTIPVYVLISVCMSTYVLIFIPMLTTVVDYSTDKGFPAAFGKYIINAMAIGDMIGRLGFGWVTDKKFLTLPMFMFYILTLQGVFVAVLPIATTLPAFVAVLVLYSATAGCSLVLFPVLVIHYIDESVQSMAIANVGLMSGVIGFGIPPMINQFRDTIGSYDGMFYLSGIISMFTGSMWLVEPISKRFKLAKECRCATYTESTIDQDPPQNITKQDIVKSVKTMN